MKFAFLKVNANTTVVKKLFICFSVLQDCWIDLNCVRYLLLQTDS